VNHTQTAQSLFAEGIISCFRQQDTFLITNNDILNGAGSTYQESNLTAYFPCEVDQQSGKVLRDNFRWGDFPPIETFELGQMKMLQTA